MIAANKDPRANLPQDLTQGNRDKLAILNRVLRRQLDVALAAGFHGTATIELAVVNGTIQTVRHRLETIEK